MDRRLRAHRFSIEEGDYLAINLGSISKAAVDKKIKNERKQVAPPPPKSTMEGGNTYG